MSNERIYYSILRVVPDERRGEIVNVGLVIFLPDELDVHILPSLTKVRTIDGRVSIDDLYTSAEQLRRWANEVEGIESKHQAIKEFGLFTVSELGWFKVTQSEDYERTVKKLMADLVVPQAKTRSSQKIGRLQTELKNYFRSQRLLGKTIEDVSRRLIVPNYPVAPEDNLYADFALKNGTWMVTETLDYRVRTIATRFKDAALKAVTMDQARLRLGDDTKCFLVYAADPDVRNSIQTHINLLSEYAEKVLNFEETDERALYMEQVMSVAGPNVSI